MNDAVSSIVIELAKEFIEFVSSLDHEWTKGYFRFHSEGSFHGSNASYSGSVGVSLIGAVRHREFYDSMNRKGAALLKVIGKHSGVFLLEIDASFDYKIHFEWADCHRWEITKMDGRSGIPGGL